LTEMQLQKLISEKLQLESRWAQQALEQGRVTTDMKWIDIKIKDLKTKINDQSVEDAKAGLYDIAS
jgi:16S rRNA U516 pseudouridylate synthase RsuA-like enzyme